MSSKTGEVFETLRKAVIIGDTFTRMLNPMSLDMPELLLPICGIPIIEYYIDMQYQGDHHLCEEQRSCLKTVYKESS